MCRPTAQNLHSPNPHSGRNDGYGSSLPSSRGRTDLPIGPSPDDVAGEYGDGSDGTSTTACSRQNTLSNEDSATARLEPPTPPTSTAPNTQIRDSVPRDNTPSSDNLPNQRNPTKKRNKNTRASTKIASLNMRGRGAPGDNNISNKWFHINQILKDKRIGILAIQEAHLTPDYTDTLHTLFGKRLHVAYSQGHNVNAQGVAFIINKDLLKTIEIETYEVVPGRALLLTIPWHNNQLLTILNVYAPNAPVENQNFWETLEAKLSDPSNPLPTPDTMLGDFNLVEDSLDRLPSHPDHNGAVMQLDNLRTKLRLKDGWRHTYPTTKAFSFMQGGTKVQSRIDRIYASQELMDTAVDWSIERTGILTDHKLVSVCVVDKRTPFLGRGRWTMPLFLIKDPTLRNVIHKLGLKAQDELNQPYQ